MPASAAGAIGAADNGSFPPIEITMTPSLVDDWSTPWLALLPDGARLEVRGAPPEHARGLQGRLVTGGDTLLGWGLSRSDLTATGPYRCLTLFDPDRISPAWLRSQGFHHVRHLAVIPSLEQPRWFLAWGDKRAAARGWDLYNPQSARGRVAKTMARWVTRTFGASALGRELIIAQRRQPALDQLLTRALGTSDYVLALAPRWPGPRRRVAALLATAEGRELLFWKHRISMQVGTREGEVLAYIKFAIRPGAIRAIEQEARLTSSVSGLGLETCNVPTVLHHGPLAGGYIAIFAPLGIRSRPSPAVLAGPHLALLEELVRHTAPVSTGTLVEELKRRLDCCADVITQQWRDLFVRGLTALGELVPLADLPAALAHGDFAPWNMRLEGASGRLAVFDWERAQVAQFLLYDCFHFQIQTDALLHGLSARECIPRTLGRTLDTPLVRARGLTRIQVAGLLVAYLTDSSLAWFEDHRALAALPMLAESGFQAERRAMLDRAIEELGLCRS
jgi:hypothetical protein